MARMIDADTLRSNIDCCDIETYNDKLTIIEQINEAPTVDAVEVVHGFWIDIRFDPMWRSMLATCSHCKVRGEVRVKANECGFAVPDSEYCPNCGAKMDLEEPNETKEP